MQFPQVVLFFLHPDAKKEGNCKFEDGLILKRGVILKYLSAA